MGKVRKTDVQVRKTDVEAEEARLMVRAAIELEKAQRKARLSTEALALRAGVPIKETEAVLEALTPLKLDTLVRLGQACGVFWDIRPLKRR